MAQADTAHWLALLEPAGVWCAEVLDWPALIASGALEALDVVQTVINADGRQFKTTKCPIRFDGLTLTNATRAPASWPDSDHDQPACHVLWL